MDDERCEECDGLLEGFEDYINDRYVTGVRCIECGMIYDKRDVAERLPDGNADENDF